MIPALFGSSPLERVAAGVKGLGSLLRMARG
jgi:hypothetical protein